MIVQNMLNLWVSIVEGMIHKLPTPTGDGVTALATMPDKVSQVWAYLQGFGTILPLDVMLTAVGTFTVWAAVCGSIVLVQRLISFATMGGGSSV